MRHQSSLWLSEGPKANYLRTGLFKYHKNYTNKLYDKINPKQIVIKCIASEYFSKDFIELNCSFAHITLTFVVINDGRSSVRRLLCMFSNTYITV